MIVPGGTCSSELAPLLPLLAKDACSRKPFASGVLTPYPSSQPAPAATVRPCQDYVLGPFFLTKQTTSCMPARSNSVAFVDVCAQMRVTPRPYIELVCMLQVPHVRQAFNWDCGLACVLMVLQAAAPKAAGMDLATLRQYCPTTRCAPQSKNKGVTKMHWS